MTDQLIRKGGVQTPQGFLFELSGGDVSLDFVNTVDNRPTDHAKELIPTAKALFSWARQAGILTRSEENVLYRNAMRKPKETEAARLRAVRLRKCLFQVLRGVADGKELPPNVLAEWNGFVHRAFAHYELAGTKKGLRWRLRADLQKFDSILWPIIHSAIQLLTGANSFRIRRCAADNCDWLFRDSSKRGNRRWCDMTVCGNRAKAKRFYYKHKSVR